ncbi:hypothetical protein [Nocardioides lijunqiniae]|uniref:hypothetical protein n=1 Tax=Nocardioides lijunqiniae TaxID=2760832 RepID=UPI0018786856|nr:hypothetical protein [Nocardioides lijunqiniae]
MSSERPEHSGQVPAHPVALIEVDPDAGTVTMNGQPVVIAEGTDLYVAGVHAAATRVAQVLQRPVRALAKDPTGQTSLLVHPDGSVSDIQETEPAAVAPERPKVSEPAAVPKRAGRVKPAPKAASAPVSSSTAGRTSPRGVTLVSIGASLAVVATVGTALLMGGVDVGGQDPHMSSAGEPTEKTTPLPERPEPLQAIAGAVLEPKPVVNVRADGSVKRVRLTVTSNELPARARVVLVRTGQEGGKPLQRTVRLTKRGQQIRLTDLPAGTYRWRVTVSGADAVVGRVRVTAPAPPPAPPAPPEPEQPYYPETPDYGGSSVGSEGGGGGNGGDDGNGGGGPDSPVDPGNPGPDAPVPN